MTQIHTNRLIDETSPYLLQHAHNPVDWYPWGEEALAVAKREDKPILLSIGYSSCHWCHVMEHESFESEEISSLMNRRFVNIKVDREERPDIDSIYMNYVQLTTGSGGWPLTVFLTPDQVPFYGGTYFPPEDRMGRPGFKTVLESLARFYQTERHQIEQQERKIRTTLDRAGALEVGDSALSEDLLGKAFYSLLSQFDNRNGGFGGAPKFPSSMVLAFLLRWYFRTGLPSTLEAVNLSLKKMAHGGIYDQLGGGFHRYSVDDIWLVPHFEKMLYDNALLVRTYLEAFQVTGDPEFKRIVEETLSYIRRDMTHPQGGFHSAEDADSEGIEGLFYVWNPEEIDEVIGQEDGSLFRAFYGVERSGNWEGTNILHRWIDDATFAERNGLSLEDLEKRLQHARGRLLNHRNRRVRPGLDDKVLASWNGLMLTAFAEAAFVLSNDEYLETALKNADFIATEMIEDGRIYRTWKNGEARLNGYLDDYAHTAEAFLTLFQVTGEPRWFQLARELTDTQLDLFLDKERGDFFFTASDHETLLVRPKESFDNATPAGNSTTAINLLTLSRLTGGQQYREAAEQILQRSVALVSRYPAGAGNWLKAIDLYIGPQQEIVICGSAEQRRPFLQQLSRRYLPGKLIVQTDRSQPGQEKELPLLAGRMDTGDTAVAYLCRDHVCQEPTSDPLRFGSQLDHVQEESAAKR
ncbi:MAG: thioredoxin domain-containing protein [Acidobacteriota bacterium]|nr:MAG: thioredoxin domain-containing protein [Acidobacteriota bacterium]